MKQSIFRLFLPAIFSSILLLLTNILDLFGSFYGSEKKIELLIYLIAYLPVGTPVIKDAIKSFRKGDYFSEFFLMTIATFGAFYIGEYSEAVIVMLFYTIGELLQSLAIKDAKKNIQLLIDQRPDKVTIKQGEKLIPVYAKDVNIDQILFVKPGEKLGLDGVLVDSEATFDTSALTGESTPVSKKIGETVLAGMINLKNSAHIKVTASFEHSKLSSILELVQNASKNKAPTELFIRKFAKIYTPIVVVLAFIICFSPYFFISHYSFDEWLYKALIFLVISCPCALVISIPCGYFGGIGAASKNGILFKGSNFIDILSKIKIVVFDKTGTLTKGVFNVIEVNILPKFKEDEILNLVQNLEKHSTHPISTAITNYNGKYTKKVIDFDVVEELPGLGLKGIFENQTLLIGNEKLIPNIAFENQTIRYKHSYTEVFIALNGQFVGNILISDKLKDDALKTITHLRAQNIKSVILSGDSQDIVQEISLKLSIDEAYGNLLPNEKIEFLKKLKIDRQKIAFVGDGLNDAPAMACSDVGIAMGGLGSDATIEAADIVIQDDRLLKIPLTINICKKTKQIVWQNIFLAFGIKCLVLVLSFFGFATMWEAIIADVGVALCAILNAIRIQNMNFHINNT